MDIILKPETIKLIGSTNNKIIKNKNGKYVFYLEVGQIVFVDCIVVILYF